MKQTGSYLRQHLRLLAGGAVLLVILAGLLLYHLGSLTGGLSHGELQVASQPLGWHGLYHNALYLPLNFVRSVIFFAAPQHGQTLTRIGNALFGFITVIGFAGVVKLWHGGRITLLTTLLFACSAWTLHVSRLASFDVLYLWGITMLVLSNVAMQRWAENGLVFYGSLLLWGALLYIPGFIWLLLVNAFWLRSAIADGWQHFNLWWHRALYGLAGLIWLPLLIKTLLHSGNWKVWLGLPAHFAAPLTILKHFVAVFLHLLVRGPQYPPVWLGRTPILDVFCLATFLIGIYFYARRYKAYRSQLLASFFVIGVVLVTLGGAVSLSILVPLLYMVLASGIAYLLQEWLQVFPLNPLARWLGIGLVSLAVVASCGYNLRSYFVAWPHNNVTEAAFHVRLDRSQPL